MRKELLFNRTKGWINLVITGVVILLELMGVTLSARSHGLSMFQFYTEDSNLFALVAFGLYAIFLLRNLRDPKKHLPGWVQELKYLSVCCLTVTLVVVVLILAPMYGKGGLSIMMLQGSMLYHHFLCPVLGLLSLLFFDQVPIRKKAFFYSAIPTFVYAAAAILLNVLKVLTGPYPFLLVDQQPVWVSAMWFVVILSGAMLCSWLILLGYGIRTGENK